MWGFELNLCDLYVFAVKPAPNSYSLTEFPDVPLPQALSPAPVEFF